MRDYPTVPNVFRVASTHSVNAESATKAVSVGNGITAIEQQQRYQHTNNNNAQAKQQQCVNATTPITAATTGGSSSIQTTKANGNGPQLQATYHHNSNNTRSNNMINNSTMQPHKLTTTASIERNYYSASQTAGRREQQQHQQQQMQLQHSPYATLPRVMPGYAGNNHTTSNTRHVNELQEHAAAAAGAGAGVGVGVINTISGSIPATGFAANGRAVSMGSDLNMSVNNSSADLRKLNGVHDKHQQEQQMREFLVTRTDGSGGISRYQKRVRHCTSVEKSKGDYLWILTPVAASISVAIVIAALAGPQWLFTEEKLPNANYNGTANFNVLDDGAFITKYTKSSLWILCTTLQGVETYNCIKIDYFPKEGYQPDPLDSTPAIPYTVTKSCPFFLASGIFLLISFIVFLIPTCSHQNNLYYFSAGIMFIVSGLLMLIGLIAYISILKAEIGSKLRPRSTLQPALFKVTYGQSFFLFVFGFIATEFVGLLNIFLYISLQEVSYYSRLPCFTIANLQEKIKEGEHPHSHTYKSYKHPSEPKPLPRNRLNKNSNNNNNNHHQIHNIYLPPPMEMELDGKKLLQQMPGFVACRKHPNATETGAAGGGVGPFVSNDLERRYYFEKPLPPKCNLHSKNFAKSLNELYTEPAPPVGPPPPPSAIKMGAGGAQTLPRLPPPNAHTQFADMPQEFPLTRSVSTTTDIFANGHVVNGVSGGIAPPLERKNRRNMATNTRPTDTELHESERQRQLGAAMRRQHASNSEESHDDEPQERLCGLKRGIRKTKDELFQEFCKRAGMRPKPKNIYFIANEEEAERQRRRHGHGESGGRRRVRDEFHEGRTLSMSGEEENDNEMGGEEDDDEDQETEHGFKPLQEDDEHIYVIQDNSQFVAQPLRNLRRSSMYVEPTHLRKLNSNISLSALYPNDKGYQKSLFALDRSDSAADLWTADQYRYAKGTYGGSQNRLHQDYPSAQIYQSRTLPRSFLKRATDSQDSIGTASLHASASALHNTYSASQNRLTGLMLQQQQQLQQQNRFLSQSHGGGIYNSALALHKSCEDLLETGGKGNGVSYKQAQHPSSYAATTRTNQQQHQQQQRQQPHQQQHHPQRPTVSIGNASNGHSNTDNNNTLLKTTTVQWPAAIPSSPAGYAPNFHQVYPLNASVSAVHAPHLTHTIITRSASGSAASGGGSIGGGSVASAPPHVAGPGKFQRAYAFDEQRRSSAVMCDAFDLDEMERERRRSHASLFSGISALGANTTASAEHYDLINGTAV